MLENVISGGQKGVDVWGLEVAKECGLKTGGTAPKNFLTEDGCDLSLGVKFGLTESIEEGYPPRTEKNVKDSDGTVLFGNTNSPGTKLTLKYIGQHSKPHIKNPTSEQLIQFILDNKIKILNVAGNRASKLSLKDMISIKTTLRETFKYFTKQTDGEF